MPKPFGVLGTATDRVAPRRPAVPSKEFKSKAFLQRSVAVMHVAHTVSGTKFPHRATALPGGVDDPPILICSTNIVALSATPTCQTQCALVTDQHVAIRVSMRARS